MRFFIEYGKKPNIMVTMITVYLYFDSKSRFCLTKFFENLKSISTLFLLKDMEVVSI